MVLKSFHETTVATVRRKSMKTDTRKFKRQHFTMSDAGDLPKCAIRRRGPYFILFLLCLAQVAASLTTHSLVARLTLCDSILFTISMSRRIFTNPPPVKYDVFLRLVGLIAFQALVFVNFTHGMEVLFSEEHDTHISPAFIIVTCADVAIKSLLLFTGTFPTLGLCWPRRILLHFLATTTVGALATVNAKFGSEKTDYVALLDPYCGMAIATLLSLISIPIIIRLLPYLLADIPESFELEKFVNDIEKKFSNTKCLHLHVFRQWPRGNFDAIMHVKIELNQASSNEPNHGEAMVKHVLEEARSSLIVLGAKKVTIQPHISFESRSAPEEIIPPSKIKWTPCITAVCEDNSLTCCQKKSLLSAARIKEESL